jgi:transglutaminase-like putative cysteine protease
MSPSTGTASAWAERPARPWSGGVTLTLLLVLSSPTEAAGPAGRVSVAPVPDWVREWSWVAPEGQPRDEKSEGTRCLLFESHKHAQRSESFTHLVLLMENETGVQDSGSLTFQFNAEFQDLLLHRVQIVRAGKTLDRLVASKVKTIQPEPDLASHLYTGDKSALLFLEDLRVGDILEYAYTVRGANPLIDGHFATRIPVQSSAAVDRQRIRVVWESPKTLHQRAYLTEVAPMVKPWGRGREYVWDFTDVEGIPYEDDLPDSYEPYAYLEFSDFEAWEEVVQWALPLYASEGAAMPRELRDLIAQWQAAPTPEGRARRALQFVQDELRYTGLELGPDSFRPAPPFESFRLRYGDCKGKVALLCAILREMGMEARPALVSAALHETVARRLPSPFAFDHAIVRLTLEGKTVWLDPTISHQGGVLWRRALPPLGKALVIAPGVSALENIPARLADEASQRITSTFTLKDGEAPAALEVSTAFKGSEADRMREHLARTAAEDVSKGYVNFYARYYPGVSASAPLQFVDNRDRNVLTVTERYRIENIWEPDESGKRLQVEFHPEAMDQVLPDPSTRMRKMPLGVDFPMRREQEVIVHLPDDDWNVPAQERSIEHAAFSFRYGRSLSGSTLRFKYECETRAPAIAAGEVPDFLEKRAAMQAMLGDVLFRPRAGARGLLERINWLMVTVAVFGMASTLAAGLWFWHATGPVSAPPVIVDPAPLLSQPASPLEGLGGWLVLVGIGLFVNPVYRCAQLVQNWEGWFSAEVWQGVAMPTGQQYHALFGPLLIFEVLGNIALVAFNILLISMFLARRRAFPMAYIVMFALSVLFMLADEIAGNMIPVVAAKSNATSGGELARAVVAGAIWSTYMLRSRRVKETFVR